MTPENWYELRETLCMLFIFAVILILVWKH